MSLADEKTRAEIDEIHVRIVRMLTEVEKMVVEMRKEEKSTTKIIIESFFYPFVAASAFMGATLAIVKYFSG